MTATPDQVIAQIREALEVSMDKPLTSADRLRVTVDEPCRFSDYISEDVQWAIESLEALLSALEARREERDAAFALSKCECGQDEACANLARFKARAEAAEAERDALRKALAPLFARADKWQHNSDNARVSVKLGDLRRARTLSGDKS